MSLTRLDSWSPRSLSLTKTVQPCTFTSLPSLISASDSLSPVFQSPPISPPPNITIHSVIEPQVTDILTDQNDIETNLIPTSAKSSSPSTSSSLCPKISAPLTLSPISRHNIEHSRSSEVISSASSKDSNSHESQTHGNRWKWLFRKERHKSMQSSSSTSSGLGMSMRRRKIGIVGKERTDLPPTPIVINISDDVTETDCVKLDRDNNCGYDGGTNTDATCTGRVKCLSVSSPHADFQSCELNSTEDMRKISDTQLLTKMNKTIPNTQHSHSFFQLLSHSSDDTRKPRMSLNALSLIIGHKNRGSLGSQSNSTTTEDATAHDLARPCMVQSVNNLQKKRSSSERLDKRKSCYDNGSYGDFAADKLWAAANKDQRRLSRIATGVREKLSSICKTAGSNSAQLEVPQLSAPNHHQVFLHKLFRSGGGPTTEEVERWAKSFDSVLHDKYGVLVFREFLRTEFSDENIRFWLTCEDYRNRSSTKKMQRRALKIFNEFVAVQAIREVNLDSNTRLQTEKDLLFANKHTFDQCQKRIQSLMEKDSYRRFLRSDLYLTALEMSKQVALMRSADGRRSTVIDFKIVRNALMAHRDSLANSRHSLIPGLLPNVKSARELASASNQHETGSLTEPSSPKI